MSDVAPSSNPLEYRALASFEVEGAGIGTTWWSTRAGWGTVLVEPLEDPNVAGAWIGMYRVVASNAHRTVRVACHKSALVIDAITDDRDG